MNKLASALVAGVALVAITPASSHALVTKNLACDGTYTGVTVKNVTVKSGDSCTLIDSTVLGNVHGKKGAIDIRILDTDVAHNINVMGATGTVQVANKGGKCKYDPHVGNNLMVKKSHNVLICEATVDNNIMITGNDGRISVLRSSAGNHIMVNRNLAYVSDGNDSDHRRPDIIRVYDCHATKGFQFKHNARKVNTRNLTTG